MEYKKIRDYYVLRLDIGDEVIESITKLCNLEKIHVGIVSGIGACDYVKVGLYDTIKKEYFSKEFVGPMEITSLTGNISTKDKEVYIHAHINVCNDKMQVFGGHLNICKISATCEIIIHNIDGRVERKYDNSIGLNLFDFENIGEV